MSTGKRLKEERTRLGLTQAELASIGSVAKTTQINYESDERAPNSKYLYAIAEKGADILYIVVGERRDEAPAPTFNRDLLIEIIEHIEKWAAERETPITVKAKVQLVELFYDLFRHDGIVNVERMDEQLALVA